ncbi:PAC2 family protein [uncultured archaeon]|nr:PAC2 family protein [uncultured archaeon]
MIAEVNFVEYGKQDLKGYTLIEGYPGMGLVGTIAAKYLVEKLKFEEIGYIDSNIFAPVIRIHAGMPVRPARVYADKASKVAVLISEQVIPRHFSHLVAKKTVEWIESKGIKELVSLSGVQSSGDKSQMVFGIAANEASRELLKRYSLREIPEGITTGVTALILLGLRNSKVMAISMLANVQLSADYKATAEVLKKLNEMLGLNLNVEPLLEEAKQMEKQLLEQLQKLKDTKDNAENFEHRTPLVT